MKTWEAKRDIFALNYQDTTAADDLNETKMQQILKMIQTINTKKSTLAPKHNLTTADTNDTKKRKIISTSSSSSSSATVKTTVVKPKTTTNAGNKSSASTRPSESKTSTSTSDNIKSGTETSPVLSLKDRIKQATEVLINAWSQLTKLDSQSVFAEPVSLWLMKYTRLVV